MPEVTVTAITAEESGRSFVSATITNGQLILTRRNGQTVNVGSVNGGSGQTPATAPGEITSPNASTTTNSIQLTWTAPTSPGTITGGAAATITDYIIQYKLASEPTVWTPFEDGNSSTSPEPTGATITGLPTSTSATPYNVRIAARNSAGLDSGWVTTNATLVATSSTPATAPGVPLSLSAVASPTQMALSWNAPSSPGTIAGGASASIQDYIIEFSTDGGANWSTIDDGTSTATSYTHTGLTATNAHRYRVSARNNAPLTGSPANMTIPAQVQGLAAIALNSTSVQLGWNQPASGGVTISDYVVQFKRTADSSWSTFADGTTSTLGTTVTGLLSNTSYDFRVCAVNADGFIGALSSVFTGSTTAGSTPIARSIAPTANKSGVMSHSTIDGGTHAQSLTLTPSGNIFIDSANASLTVSQGQYPVFESDPYFGVSQSFIEFNTSVGGGTVTNATMKLDLTGDLTTVDFQVDLYSYDFGATVEVADMRTATQVGALTLLATLNTSGIGANGLKTMTVVDQTAFNAAVNSGGTSRFILVNRNWRTGVAPALSTNQEISFGKANTRLEFTA